MFSIRRLKFIFIFSLIFFFSYSSIINFCNYICDVTDNFIELFFLFLFFYPLIHLINFFSYLFYFVFYKFIFLSIIFLPILSLIITFSFSFIRLYSIQFLIVFNIFSIFFIFLCVLLSFILFYIFNFNLIFDLFYWINIGLLNLKFTFVFDLISILMLFIVSLVSALVHLYSLSYMSKDPHHLKFMQYLTLFTLAMFVLITSGNLIQMFIGWEGVGICSFLLINFWDTRILANTSAIKAVLTNRIGDLSLVFSFILLWTDFYGCFDYITLLAFIKSNFFNLNFNWIALFIFFGAVGKSAQIFLHIWLPDAMEGPTPVSALIHAATMVTAGVFILIRFSFLIELSSFVVKLILIFGSITALFAGTVGTVQMDVKKIIAYSTCSQLGFMFVACGLSAFDIALFHLAMHAFFKALLFLSAGSLIHSFFYDEQDIRRFGGLLFFLPLTYISFLIGSFALMGFPFLSGFFSKDLILELLIVNNCPITKFSIFCCFLAVFCTSFYSLRLLYISFYALNKNTKYVLSFVHESSFYIVFPLILLSIFSIFGGFFFKDFFISFSLFTNNFNNWFFISYIHTSLSNFFVIISYFNIEEIYFFRKNIANLIIFFSFFFFFYVYIHKTVYFFYKLKIFLFFFRFLTKKWYFDIVYMFFIKIFINNIYLFLFKTWDRGFLELVGPYGSVLNLYFISNSIYKLTQFKNIYIFYILFFTLFVIYFVLTLKFVFFY